MTQQQRKYGFRPSLTDERDKVANPVGLTVLPMVDLSLEPAMPAIWDQGNLGSCTSFAAGAAFQFDISLDRRLQGLGNAHRRSNLDIYYGERELEGSLGSGDVGAVGRDAFKFAQQTGVLLATVWPYDISTYEGPPPPGRRHKLTKPYALVDKTEDAIKAVLSNKQTIAFGFNVYESFESDLVAQTGIMPMPRSGEQKLGGHEPLLVGYDEANPSYVKVRNSWSQYWGLGGYFLMPWDYLLSGETSDFRTIVRATA